MYWLVLINRQALRSYEEFTVYLGIAEAQLFGGCARARCTCRVFIQCCFPLYVLV